MNQVGVFGVPWHGLVRDGVLELPNGLTRPHGAPAGDDVRYGDTVLVRMPWAPGAERSAEDAAADEAAGRQWVQYAILGGGEFKLHGKPLPNRSSSQMSWLYGAPDQTVWEVSFSRFSARAQSSNRSSIPVGINLRRFGHIPARSTTQYVWLGDYPISQQEPSFTVGDSGRTYADLMDVMPDGSKAIIALYYAPNAVLSNPRLACPVYPIGIWMVSLSGVPGRDLAAQFIELKTRAECIGDLTVVDSRVSGPSTVYNHRAERTGEDVWTHWYEERDGGYQYYPTLRYALRNKILAMWFDDDGNPQPVTLSHDYVRTEDYTEEASQRGGPATSDRQQGNWSLSSPIYIDQVRTSVINETLSVVLSYQGSSVRWDASSSGSYIRTRNSAMVHLAGGSGIDQGISTETSDYRRVTPHGETEGQIGFSLLPKSDYDALTAWPPLYLAGVTVPVVIRYSNNALTLMSAPDIFTGPFRHWPCLTPKGIQGGLQDYPLAARHGSYNPATGQVERGAQTPLCWT